ncbi:MaoC family dehydratase N-terminal domain-containing protein [Microbacterium sp. CFH 31415]|uniref:FAS1-like dehydratase domain-containing protein n=1 Tax=Microbacterium sp. CFH 31415 TaxID=2921732 RepID=UPI001F146B32|nr:MaoC family dehydratase N-terminal domain-containing protein [Microbacterium sp. CFH 31415]MCH6231629.1 MaoC family dehydratase N-terminal domain-containing protein [Microbacterium sp. CFH 31415]
MIDPDELQSFVDQIAEPPRVSRYPVDVAMIRNWAEALDDRNPIYVDADAARATGRTGIVAPPAMISTWVMNGYRRWREIQRLRAEGAAEDNAYSQLLAILDAEGYTSVVATDVEQTYEREVHPGDRVTCHYTIEAVAGPKRTALGEGWFLTLGKRYEDATGAVFATERFRMLRFRPEEKK